MSTQLEDHTGILKVYMCMGVHVIIILCKDITCRNEKNFCSLLLIFIHSNLTWTFIEETSMHIVYLI